MYIYSFVFAEFWVCQHTTLMQVKQVHIGDKDFYRGRLVFIFWSIYMNHSHKYTSLTNRLAKWRS